jgi:hypothetical protein
MNVIIYYSYIIDFECFNFQKSIVLPENNDCKLN